MHFIDIHCHILPGMDDGAKDIQESISMARIAEQDGIDVVVATPHVIKGTFNNTKDTILEKVENLNDLLERNRIKLRVLPGAEYRLENDLPMRLAQGELLTINNTGRYLMIELPASSIPLNTDKILYEIQLQGVTPIIAHPERNSMIAKNPNIIRSFFERGIHSQVTAASVTGLFGKRIQKVTMHLLESGTAQILASDAHGIQGRSPLLSKAASLIKDRWCDEDAQRLVSDNPGVVLKGDLISETPSCHRSAIWKVMHLNI